MIKQQFKLKALAAVCASAMTLAAFVSPVQAKEDANKTVDEQYIWDLTDFYKTQADWEAELKRLRGEANSLEAF